MGAVYTYSEARQKFASILDKAASEGEVIIKRKDGQTFTIKPVKKVTSPLDVQGIDLDISTQEIIDLVREGREKQDNLHQ